MICSQTVLVHVRTNNITSDRHVYRVIDSSGNFLGSFWLASRPEEIYERNSDM